MRTSLHCLLLASFALGCGFTHNEANGLHGHLFRSLLPPSSPVEKVSVRAHPRQILSRGMSKTFRAWKLLSWVNPRRRG